MRDMQRPPRPDYLKEERELYVLESRAVGASAWVVEDHFGEHDLANEQRVWLVPRYPLVTFRITRYVPDPDGDQDTERCSARESGGIRCVLANYHEGRCSALAPSKGQDR